MSDTRQTDALLGADTRELDQSDVLTGGRPESLTPLSRGSTVGRYVIVDRLGAGGMGVVYRAFDPDLDRSIALKLVTIAASSRADDERTRLLREAQAMARLAHPNVIPVFDVGVAGTVVFVAMELVDGVTLARWCEQSPRPWPELLAAFVQAGNGLAAAHRADLVHRDFKPDNVMVGHDGRVRVLDFGLARQAGSSTRAEHEATAEIRSSSGRASRPSSLDQALTVDGAVMGTPRYMSPEQHLGALAHAASDQFSFCVALWEALYATRPFAGETMAALSMAVLQGQLADAPAGSKVPTHIQAALVRGLAVEPARRHASMDALLHALQRDPGARRRRAALLGGAGAVILGAGAWLGIALERTPEPIATSPCTGAEAIIDATWNDTRKDALAAGFAASGQPYAPAVWSTVATAIDGYALDWTLARTQACTATRIAGEQSEALMDLRMLCLDRSHRELDALLHALADANEQTVERAIDAVRRLPELDRCADVAWLGDPTPLPDDAEQRAAIEATQARLADVAALTSLGRYQLARLELGPLLVSAELLDHPPLVADAFVYDGELLAHTGGGEPARRAYERAFAAATAAGDVRMQALLATQLAHEVGVAQSQRAEGESWLRIGRALVRRQGGDPRREAELDASEGGILVAAGQYEAAIVAHQRALARFVALDPDGVSVARTLDDIGSAEVRLGRIDEAVANHRRAIEIRTRIYGASHPLVATSERELGGALSLAGRYDEAIGPLERALAIHREARGDTNVSVATVLDDLGRVARRKGDLDTALARHREALAIWEATLGDPHPDLAVSLLNVGYTLVAAEHPAEAVEIETRALAMFERSLGAEHPYIVYAGNALGMAQLSAGHPAEAIAPLERALALRGKIEADPTLFADTMFALAKARFRSKTGAAADAIALAGAGRELFATQGERWATEIAEIDAWTAAPR